MNVKKLVLKSATMAPNPAGPVYQYVSSADDRQSHW
jgi:hypothetical protein